MELKDAVLPGAGGLIIGLLLGVAMSGSGDDVARAGLEQTKALQAKVEAMSTEVKGLGDRLGGLEGSLKTQGEGVAGLASRIDGVVDGVAEKVSASVSGSVDKISGSVDKLGGGVSETLKSELAGLKSELSSLIARPAPVAQVAAPAAEPAAAPAAAVAASGTALTPGMTAVVKEGALNVFLSGADAEAGTARVAVNGQSLVALTVGTPIEAAGCSVVLTGFDESGAAMIDGSCDGAPVAAAAAAAPVAGTSGTALGAGATLVLGDGKARVFMSGADAAAGTARVAVNGQNLVSLEIGKPIEAEGCKISLTGFDAAGLAMIDGGC